MRAVFLPAGVLGNTVRLVAGGDGEHKEEREGGARDEGEEVGVSEGVDVLERQVGAQAEFVNEGGEEFGVAPG